MKKSLSAVSLCFFLLGCRNTARKEVSLHDTAHRARPPFVDIAVNLGLRHNDDLLKLYDSLASAGMRCGIRAMSLDAEQIVVEREDFDRAKAIVTSIVVRDHLTVRVYESPDFEKTPTSSLLEVWEEGKKVTEEKYKLYLSSYTGDIKPSFP